METADQRRQDMRLVQIEQVALAVHIGRHHRPEVGIVLTVEGLAQLQTGDLRQSVGLNRRLQLVGQERILPHRLRRFARIGTGTGEEHHPLHTAIVRRLEDVRLNHQIFVDEVGRIGRVGDNPAGQRRGQKEELRPSLVKETIDRHLVPQVQLLTTDRYQVGVALTLQQPRESRADHPGRTGYQYRIALVHRPVSLY